MLTPAAKKVLERVRTVFERSVLTLSLRHPGVSILTSVLTVGVK